MLGFAMLTPVDVPPTPAPAPPTNKRSEQSIASARASVMIYDDASKKWFTSGTSSGLSKVQIYHHTTNNTFRVVGRKLCDHEVVINFAISKGLKYNVATETFHQWRDNKQVYGLNFSTKEDADSFARSMYTSLDTLSNLSNNRVQTTPPQITPNSHSAYGYPTAYIGQANDDEVEYRMAREDTASLERRVSNAQMLESPNQGPPGHHRTSSAPPAPQPPNGPPLAPPAPPAPPPGPPQQQWQAQPPGPPPTPAWSQPPGPPMAPGWPVQQQPPVQTWGGGPPVPPQPAAVAAGPPPPPPPPSMPRSSSSDGHDTNSLAAQLQSTRLKRINHTSTMPNNAKQSAENSGSSTSSGGSNYGTLGRGGMGSMASMMDEMAKTLARRRAAVEKKDTNDDDHPVNNDKKWNDRADPKMGNNHSGPGDESPKVIRKRFGSEVSDGDLHMHQRNHMNGVTGNGEDHSSNLSPEFELLKQEILKDIRRDLAKMKQEILDAIKSDGIRR